MMVETLFVAVIPAALVVLGGIIVLRKGSERSSSQRFLLYFMFIGILLIAVTFTIELISLKHDSWLTNRLSILIAPIAIGVLSLILVNLKQLAALGAREKILVAIMGVILLALSVSSVWLQPFGMTQMILAGTLVLAAIWIFVGKYDALGVVLSLIALTLLVLFNAGYLDSLDPLPDWLGYLVGLVMFSMPGFVVALAAVWITSAFKAIHKPAVETPWISVILRFGLAGILLGYLAYTILWTSIWDHTSDGLGGIMFSMWASLAAIAAGMVMSIKTTGWRKPAGFVFALLVPGLMFAVFRYGWDVSYHAITEERATRIQDAIESFYIENERYPQELTELVPNHLLWIPEPVILRGEEWCYQGDQDYYRLGAFFREYFSTPLSLHIYASAGDLPETGWPCEQKLAEMKALYDPPPFSEMEAVRPTAEPLPTSIVPVPRTPVQPLLSARFIIPGSWSRDGKFLLFGQLETFHEQSAMRLYFLDAAAGEICPTDKGYPPESGLRENHVWLPDGRLLYVSEAGEMDLFTPCKAGAENIADRYPVHFSQVAATDPTATRILLKNQDSFWILDGISLDGWPIPEVSPNPYELHWDQSAWSPDGEWLAISRLNGREREAGSTLYLVVGDSGEVAESQPLKYASDQSAPLVEWLTNDELLFHGGGILGMVDYHSESPKIIDIMKEIFALDIAYPDDIASMASIVDAAGESFYLVVRLNRIGNQDVYLYDSKSGSVTVYHPTASSLLLFFPGGEWTELQNLEFGTSEQDIFELIWVDTPGNEPQHIEVQGHIPRNYPALFPRYLPQSSQIVFRSSQGISIVSIPDGETRKFWELLEGDNSLDIYLRVSPDEDTMVAIVDSVRLYNISLPP